MADDYHLSCGLLLDAFNKNTYGGTGEAFDWRLAKVALDLPVILAPHHHGIAKYQAALHTTLRQ
jgi:hypothetical protein